MSKANNDELEQISYREFGRRYGLSGEGVRKAVVQGRIPDECVGEIILKSGRPRPCIEKPEQAAKALGLNTNPSQQRNNDKISEALKKSHADKKSSKPSDDADEAADPEEEFVNSIDLEGKIIPKVALSNRMKEFYAAKTAKLKYEVDEGKLVNAEQFKTHYSTLVKAAVSRLRGVGTNVKSRIHDLSVDDVQIIEDMIDEALQELADGG